MKRVIYLTAILSVSLCHILRLPECNKYDAIFSKIKYDVRLVGDILEELSSSAITLRKCLTKCMLHSTCLSINFMRENSTCELLGVAAQKPNAIKNPSYVQAPGWKHFETDYTAKKV